MHLTTFTAKNGKKVVSPNRIKKLFFAFLLTPRKNKLNGNKSVHVVFVFVVVPSTRMNQICRKVAKAAKKTNMG
jgi:hypothetical protein